MGFKMTLVSFSGLFIQVGLLVGGEHQQGRRNIRVSLFVGEEHQQRRTKAEQRRRGGGAVHSRWFTCWWRTPTRAEVDGRRV